MHKSNIGLVELNRVDHIIQWKCFCISAYQRYSNNAFCNIFL